VAKPMTLTKASNREIVVKFSGDLPALKKVSTGGEIPVEYLHSILNFHVTKQDPAGKVNSKHLTKVKAYW
jgi:hypothetical protein